MNNGIKNINHETIIHLADQIEILPAQVCVSLDIL